MRSAPLIHITALKLSLNNSPGQWNAYVEGGKTKLERNIRLAEVPDELREDVKNHVITVFKLRRRR